MDEKYPPVYRPLSEKWMTEDSIFDVYARSLYKSCRYLFQNMKNGNTTHCIYPIDGHVYNIKSDDILSMIDFTMQYFHMHIRMESPIIEITNIISNLPLDLLSGRNVLYNVINAFCICFIIQENNYEYNHNTAKYIINKTEKKCCDTIMEVSDVFPKELYPIILSY